MDYKVIVSENTIIVLKDGTVAMELNKENKRCRVAQDSEWLLELLQALAEEKDEE